MAIKNKFIAQANNTSYGHRNYINNGDFQVWQRGTSFSNATTNANAYTADRWVAFRLAWAANISTTQRQTQTNSKGIRVQRNAGDTSTNGLVLGQMIESKEASKLAGKIVTIQFKAMRGANYSAASNLFTLQVVSGTGTDEAPTGGLTGSSTILNYSVALNTTLSQYATSFTVPSNCNELQVLFQYAPTGTAGAADYFEITDIQLEEGSFATAFERKPFAYELMSCQRYYEKSYPYANYAGDVSVSTGGVKLGVPVAIPNGYQICQAVQFVVEKRISPTVNIFSYAGASNKCTSWGAVDNGTNSAQVTGSVGTKSFPVFNNSGISIAATVEIMFHYTANADL